MVAQVGQAVAPRVPAEQEVAVYKAYLDDLGRLGGRHETLRAFYLTLVSALATILGLTSSTGPFNDVRDDFQFAVGATGLLLALVWSAHMRSFSVYFQAKREVLSELEAGWTIAPFSKETDRTSGGIYRVTYADQLIAVSFMIFFGSLVVMRFSQ
jgi:hypothetical protein